MPASAYPAILSTERVVSRQALVSYRGNRYSVPPELTSAQVTVSQVLRTDVIDIVTTSGITIARHRLAADGPGAMVRDHGHIHSLEQAAMAGANNTSNDLRWAAPAPDTISVGTNLDVTATVDSYEESSCLFILDPVATAVR